MSCSERKRVMVDYLTLKELHLFDFLVSTSCLNLLSNFNQNVVHCLCFCLGLGWERGRADAIYEYWHGSRCKGKGYSFDGEPDKQCYWQYF